MCSYLFDANLSTPFWSSFSRKSLFFPGHLSEPDTYPIYILHAPILLILEAATGSITGGYALPATLVISVLIVLIMDETLVQSALQLA